MQKSMYQTFLSSSPSQTRKWAEKMAHKILHQNLRQDCATVLALKGELGSGKTLFVQSFAKGLGIREKILSPTFVITKKFRIPISSPFQTKARIQKRKLKNFYHIDCYRIKESRELVALGFAEIVSHPYNIVAIEWADHCNDIIPKDALWIHFYWRGKTKREIQIRHRK